MGVSKRKPGRPPKDKGNSGKKTSKMIDLVQKLINQKMKLTTKLAKPKSLSTESIKLQLGQLSPHLDVDDAIGQLSLITFQLMTSIIEEPLVIVQEPISQANLPLSVNLIVLMYGNAILGLLNSNTYLIVSVDQTSQIQSSDDIWYPIMVMDINFDTEDMLSSYLKTKGVQVKGGVTILNGYVYLLNNVKRFNNAIGSCKYEALNLNHPIKF